MCTFDRVLAATQYLVLPHPFHRILILFRWPCAQSKTISQHFLAANGHLMVQSQFFPTRCKIMGKCFKRGSNWAGMGRFSHMTFSLSLAWNRLKETARWELEERAEVEKRVALVTMWQEPHAKLAEEKQRSASLMVLWSCTPGQNWSLRLLTTLKIKF